MRPTRQTITRRLPARLAWPALLLGALGFAALAAGPDPRPASFFGTVTLAGNPIADGTVVSASIGGTQYAATTTFAADGSSAFRLHVPGDEPATPPIEGGVEGQTVVFHVEGSEAPERGVWGDGSQVRIDLTAIAGTDLAIVKDDGVAVASPGETLVYRLTVTNQGPFDATGVKIEDVLPAQVTFVLASDGGTQSGGVVTWPPFDLALGASAVRTLTVEADLTFPADAEELTNTATVRSDGADGVDPDASNNTATDVNALDAAPDLAVVKTDGRDEVSPGEELTYVLTVTNAGTQDAAGVMLVDTLPPDVTFLTASDDGGESGAGSVSWPPFDLAAGETAERTVRVRFDGAPGVTEITNTATATPGNGPDRDPGDNTGTDTTAVAQRIDLDVVAVDPAGSLTDPQSLEISGTVRVEIVNLGNAKVTAPFEVVLFEDSDGDGVLTAGADNVLARTPVSGGVLAGETAGFDIGVAGTVLFRGNRIHALADSAGEIDELDETNNVGHSAEGCVAPPVPEDFAPAVETSWPADDANLIEPLSVESMSTPIVVQLTDDDGDGRIDSDDVPDVVFVTANLVNPLDPRLKLRAVSGDTGRSLWAVDPPASLFLTFSLSGLAAGDLDGDGVAEIVVATPEPPLPPFDGFGNRLTAYEHTGQRKWSSAYYETHPTGATFTNRDNPTIADLDGDGTPEIVVGANVFNANGTLRWAGSGGQAYQSARNDDAVDSGAISIVADLDLENDPEVVTGNTAYRSDGSIYWQVAMDDGYPAVGNFDADDFPEVVVVARGRVRLHEHDGALIWGPVDLPGAGAEAGGAPTVADFDADGEPEIGVAGSTQYAVFETDGTVKWQRTIRDGSSNMTGSTVFDFDGDGRYEVVYRDETHLRIYRGEDGTVLFEDPLSSFTANEEPVVADVDGDGRAEILVTSDRASQLAGIPARTFGLRVYGDANDNWVGTRKVWNQHAYHADNVRENGTVPARPAPGWLDHNTFRANLPPAGGVFDAPDVTASRVVIDFEAYPALVFTVRIGNGGLTRASAGLPVAFYDGDPAAGGALLGVAELAAALEPGAFQDLSLSAESAGFGPATVFVVAGDDGAGGGARRECAAANNAYALAYDTDPVGLLLRMADGVSAVQPGAAVTYALTVSNASGFARTGIVLSDALPPFTTFVGASDGGAEAGGAVVWPAFDLPSGASAVRTLTLRVDASIPVSESTVTNAATVADDGSRGDDPSPGNNSASDTNQVLTVRADAGGPYSGGEGTEIVFDASASADRDGAIVLYEWDFDGDGQFDDAVGVTAGHAFGNEGAYQVAVRVTDDSGEVDTDAAEVTVSNLPPAVDAGPDRTLTEGDAATLAVTFADPGTADTHTATVDWGDGTTEAGLVDETDGAGSVLGGHVYPDDGAFDVEVCVRDELGATACDTFRLTVENSDPVVIEGDGTVDLRTWTVEDLRARLPSGWVVAGDGSRVVQTLNSDPSFFYGDFLATGVRLEGTIRVDTPRDDDYIGFALGFKPGDTDNPDADYLLINWLKGSSPLVTAFSVDCIGEFRVRRGLSLSRVRGIPTNALLASEDPHPCYRLGSVERLARGLTRGATAWREFTDYTFTFDLEPDHLRVWVNGALEFDLDGDFNFGSGRFAFYNSSQEKVVYQAFASQGASFLEGESAQIDVPFSDLGIEDTHTATIDWGDGTVETVTVAPTPGLGRVAASHVYGDDGDFDVEVCVLDDDGGRGCGTVSVTVLNVVPEVDAGPARAATGSGPFVLEASFTDPGVLDTHTATIDWGDGTVTAATVGGTATDGTVSGSHAYAELGDYEVEVCVADDDGVGCDRIELVRTAPVLDLGVVKVASRPAAVPGETVTYTVGVENRGSLVPQGVVVRDALPAGLGFVSASGGGVFDGGTVTWSLPSLAFRERVELALTVTVDAGLPFGMRLDNTVAVEDDGSQGPDARPDDNGALASVRVWDGVTPRVEPRAVVNLARAPGVSLAVSSSAGTHPATRGIDGRRDTSWLTRCGDSARAGKLPYYELVLPHSATVSELRFFANTGGGHTILAGNFQLFDERGRVLFETRERSLPAPGGSLTVAVPEVRGVRRVRLTDTWDEASTCSPGFGELEVYGVFGVPGPVLAVAEGETVSILARFTDTDPAETHTATIDWGDGSTDAMSVREAAGSGTVLESHAYAPEDGAYLIEICVTDSSQRTGCETLPLSVGNVAPRVSELELDLRRWREETLPGPNNAPPAWAVSADGFFVEQLFNTDQPTIFYGDYDAMGARLEGRVRVRADIDDDFVGFVFGFQPGDATNPEADYLLVDWKMADQSGANPCSSWATAVRGLAVSRIRGVPLNHEFSTHVDHPCNPQGGVEELARGLSLGDVGWQRERDYVFTFEYTPDRFRVFVDGRLEIDVEGSFPPGRFGFENQSQQEVRYSGFFDPSLVADEGTPFEHRVLFVDPGLLDTHSATVDWGDGHLTAGTVTALPSSGLVVGSHAYGDDGTYPTEVCVTDDDGGVGCGRFAVDVRNLPPVVEAPGDAVAILGAPFDLPAGFTDPGFLDSHTVAIAWGDGATGVGTAVPLDVGTWRIEASHTYQDEGVYGVEVCVTDDDGGAGCDSLGVTVTAPPVLEATKVDALSLDANGDGVVNPGDRVTYTLTVSNTGQSPATGVSLVDAIPAHTSVLAGSVTATQGTVVSEDPIQADLGTIAAGASAMVSFQVEIENPIAARVRAIVNQGTVSSVELPPLLSDDPDVPGADDPTVTPVTAAPVLEATKVDALAVDVLRDGGASPGDTLEYTITLVNAGNTSATDVVLVDPVPLDTTLVDDSAETSHGTVDIEETPEGPALEVTIGEVLGAGLETVTVRFRVVIDVPLPGENEVANQGVVSSYEVADVATDDPDLPGAADPTVTPVAGCQYGLAVDFAEGCGAVFTPSLCRECDGKVTELTLEYLGTQVDALVEVVQKKDSIVVFSGVVQPGERFTFLGAEGTVPGHAGTLSTEITISVNGAENARIHTSCSQPIGPGLVAGDFEVVGGWSRHGGPLCPLPPCGACDGKVTDLTLEYRGTQASVFVEVFQDKDADSGFDGGDSDSGSDGDSDWGGDSGSGGDSDSGGAPLLVFAGAVEPGDALSLSGVALNGTLSNAITIVVDGTEHAAVDTSCAEAIGPGFVAGDFLVAAGASRDGGALCPLPAACEVAGAGHLEVEGRHATWELTNAGFETVTIRAISLLWPSANGDLEKVDLDSKTVHDLGALPPAAVIDSGWKGEPEDREIEAGDTGALRLEFAADAVPGNLVCNTGSDSDSDSDSGTGDSDSGSDDGDSGGSDDSEARPGSRQMPISRRDEDKALPAL